MKIPKDRLDTVMNVYGYKCICIRHTDSFDLESCERFGKTSNFTCM